MPATVAEGQRESPARRRLLDTATRLFYGEGIHAVGIDRIIAEAGVAKATFYKHFPSKDELVRAYVEEQDRLGRALVADLPPRSPRQTLLAIFDLYHQVARQPDFRGCAFINAAAEYPDPASPVRRAVDEHRRWLRAQFRDLLAAEGHPDPRRTADILVLLVDGVLVGSELDSPTRVRTTTRAALTQLLDTST
jgi:AcrR family transcriptional regulator